MLKRDQDTLIRLYEKYDTKEILQVLASFMSERCHEMTDLQLRDQSIKMSKRFQIVNDAVTELIKNP